MFEKNKYESRGDLSLRKKAAREKFSGPPLPGYIRLSVYPPEELSLTELDINRGYYPLIVGDFDQEEIKSKFNIPFSGDSLAVSWDDFKASCLPVDRDAPNEPAIMKYFFYEQEKQFRKNIDG